MESARSASRIVSALNDPDDLGDACNWWMRPEAQQSEPIVNTCHRQQEVAQNGQSPQTVPRSARAQ